MTQMHAQEMGAAGVKLLHAVAMPGGQALLVNITQVNKKTIINKINSRI